jgi:imidazole glycerol-phosphate synthase subunit HisH
MNSVAIVDYDCGNLFSVARACERAGLVPKVTSDPQIIRKAAGVLLPGVGAFGESMVRLERMGLRAELTEAVLRGQPILGVCLGFQLLFSNSDEFGNSDGLGFLEGTVTRLSPRFGHSESKVPHVGWNRVRCEQSRANRLFVGLPASPFQYFVHSFKALPTDPRVITATTDYAGETFCVAVEHENVVGVQFHPEKSGPDGTLIYENFRNLMKAS